MVHRIQSEFKVELNVNPMIRSTLRKCLLDSAKSYDIFMFFNELIKFFRNKVLVAKICIVNLREQIYCRRLFYCFILQLYQNLVSLHEPTFACFLIFATLTYWHSSYFLN